MAGQRSKVREDGRFRVLRLLHENPELSRRAVAEASCGVRSAVKLRGSARNRHPGEEMPRMAYFRNFQDRQTAPEAGIVAYKGAGR